MSLNEYDAIIKTYLNGQMIKYQYLMIINPIKVKLYNRGQNILDLILDL